MNIGSDIEIFELQDFNTQKECNYFNSINTPPRRESYGMELLKQVSKSKDCKDEFFFESYQKRSSGFSNFSDKGEFFDNQFKNFLVNTEKKDNNDLYVNLFSPTRQKQELFLQTDITQQQQNLRSNKKSENENQEASMLTQVTKKYQNQLSVVPQKKKQKTQKIKKDCCNCQKSKCLRLYCNCFQNGGMCGKDCSCKGCYNTEEFSKVREFVMQKTQEINPLAFKKKYGTIENEGENKVLHTRGCKCNKIQCNRNYCECYKAGIGCSNMCRCNNCLNQTVVLKKDQVKQIFQKKRRKKHKIVIGEVKENLSKEKSLKNFVSFVPYKRDLKKQTNQIFLYDFNFILIVIISNFFEQ